MQKQRRSGEVRWNEVYELLLYLMKAKSCRGAWKRDSYVEYLMVYNTTVHGWSKQIQYSLASVTIFQALYYVVLLYRLEKLRKFSTMSLKYLQAVT